MVGNSGIGNIHFHILQTHRKLLIIDSNANINLIIKSYQMYSQKQDLQSNLLLNTGTKHIDTINKIHHILNKILY